MSSLIEIKKLAEKLIDTTYTVVGFSGVTHKVNIKQDLSYSFKFDSSVRRLGCCSYSKKQISLSKKLCELNTDKIDGKLTDTILHEIAHAISVHIYGKSDGRGHGANWVSVATQIGCDGKRCYSSSQVVTVEKKYTLTCPTCERETGRHRMPKGGIACGKCCNGEYNEEHRFIVVKNY